MAISDVYPVRFTKSRGKTLVRYNIKEIEVENPDGKSHVAFQCDEIYIEGEVTRSKLIAAIIAKSYSMVDEIALLNNYNKKDNVEYKEEYEAYQIHRQAIKTIVTTILK